MTTEIPQCDMITMFVQSDKYNPKGLLKNSTLWARLDLWTIFERNRPFVYIEKDLDLWVQLMKNGGKNVAFIILISVF